MSFDLIRRIVTEPKVKLFESFTEPILVSIFADNINRTLKMLDPKTEFELNLEGDHEFEIELSDERGVFESGKSEEKKYRFCGDLKSGKHLLFTFKITPSEPMKLTTLTVTPVTPRLDTFIEKYNIEEYTRVHLTVFENSCYTTTDDRLVAYDDTLPVHFYLEDHKDVRCLTFRNAFATGGHIFSYDSKALASFSNKADPNSVMSYTRLDFHVHNLERLSSKRKKVKLAFYLICCQRNYLHFLKDTLPQLFIYRWLKRRHPEMALVVPAAYKYGFIKDIYRLLGITEVIHIPREETRRYFFDTLVVPDTNRNKPTWKYEFFLHPLISKMYRELKTQITDQRHRVFSTGLVYISRRTWSRSDDQNQNLGQNNTQLRKMTNEDQLVELLTKYNFVEVFMEDFSLAEKVAILNSSRLVIQAYGAGTMTALFSQGTDYLILNSPSYKISSLIRRAIVEQGNNVDVCNFFYGGASKLKGSPWELDLTALERLLEDKYKLLKVK